MKKQLIIAIVILTLLLNTGIVMAQGLYPYADIESSWAREAITDLTNRGILGGRGNGLFGPDDKVTRGEFATIMARVYRLETHESPAAFMDVPQDYWGKSGIDAVVAAGFMSGLSKDTFGPDKPLTREQAITALVATTSASDVINEGSTKDTGYTDDKKISQWARGFIYAAKVLGIAGGYPDGSFHPQDTLTRAETATLFYRFYHPENGPAPPENLYITGIDKNTVSLKWTPSKDAKKYAVYRVINNREELLNFTLDTQYVDEVPNIDEGPRYFVKAIDGNNMYSGESPTAYIPSLSDREKSYAEDFGYSQNIKMQVLNARPGQVIDTTGLVGNRIPQMETSPIDNQDMLVFSDSPEYIKKPGIQYMTTVNGKARLYYYCVNQILYNETYPDNLRYGVFVKNTGKDEVSVSIKRATLGGTELGYESWRWLQIGAEVTYDLLNGENLNVTMDLNPGETKLISPTHFYTPVTYNNLIHGVYDIETDDEVEIYFVALGEKYGGIDDPEEKLDELPYLEPDIHDRGTFVGTRRIININVDRMQALTLADGTLDPTLEGKDEVLDKDAKLNGNYGLEYEIHVKAERNMRIMLLAQGGSYQGPIWTSRSGRFMAPKSPIRPFTQGVYIDEIKAGEEMTIRWIPPASTYLPVEFVFVEI
ncbi:MAG: S-layer homology domain-containing protein [Thermoanaerobacteraceae bacterium]|nr:S-layer homology domain-containing protein [Thermoanaerobacteraceae bacterium]